MKVLVFGTGLYYEQRKDSFKNVDIVAFLDNNLAKQGQFLDGIKIVSPEIGTQEEYDCICLMSTYEKEMKKQLLDLGVSEKKIYFRQEIPIILNDYQVMQLHYKNNQIDQLFSRSSQKRILLITHELSRSGAPIALLYAAKILKKHGFFPVVASWIDGPLKEEFVSNDIPVLIDFTLLKGTLDEKKWMDQFDLIFVNTLILYYLLEERSFSIPVIWWIHEVDDCYDLVDIEKLPRIQGRDISIFAVGNYALDAYKRYFKNDNSKILLYGIPDTNKLYKIKKEKEDKLVFAIVGLVSKRKGQDLFVEAIKKLSKEELHQAEFWIIGNDSPDFATVIHREVKEIPQIKMFGEMSREKIMELYDAIDVCVCPSRSDPMPIVATEAMMNCKVCIVSKDTGTVAYIADEENGLICETENVESLTEKIRWAIKNKNKLNSIGFNARKIYDEHFSLARFEENLLHIVNDKISGFYND